VPDLQHQTLATRQSDQCVWKKFASSLSRCVWTTIERSSGAQAYRAIAALLHDGR